MLTGEYFPNIDPKGRMNFPSKLREELGERFYITRWMDNCLAVFSEAEWGAVCEKIRQQPAGRARELQRQLSANAREVEPDKQGRIQIPQVLRERSGILGEVAVIGVFDRAEIWDRERWIEKSEGMDADFFDSKMLELGL